jgi:hypothetical protein
MRSSSSGCSTYCEVGLTPLCPPGIELRVPIVLAASSIVSLVGPLRPRLPYGALWEPGSLWVRCSGGGGLLCRPVEQPGHAHQLPGGDAALCGGHSDQVLTRPAQPDQHDRRVASTITCFRVQQTSSSHLVHRSLASQSSMFFPLSAACGAPGLSVSPASFLSSLPSELPLGVGPSSLPAPAFVLPTPVRSPVDARVRQLLTELAAQGNLHGIQVSRARRFKGQEGRRVISRAYNHEVELARPGSRLMALGI